MALLTVRTVLVLHGPNLNLLGQREPETYGSTTLNDVDDKLLKLGKSLSLQVSCRQSNSEAELIDRVQQCAGDGTDFVIINPAAFTHTSIALRDALLAVALPFIEVHISNVHSREAFRQHSYFSDKAVGVICGLGPQGYELALQAAAQQLSS